MLWILASGHSDAGDHGIAAGVIGFIAVALWFYLILGGSWRPRK